ncbi:O-antigen ligase family protein, partial [Candidatus Parcubacteria bacterium]|nr:O-antigen ligase family protein [Candidatus Parcubacteria bacterium]
IALFFLLNRRNLNRKVFSIEYLVLSVFLLIISITLFFTYSYGAFLGVFAGAVYLLAVGNDKKSRLSFTHFRSPTPNLRSRTPKMLTFKFFSDKLLLIILLSFLFAGFIFITSNKFDQIINSSSRSSFHSRLMIWNSTGEIIKDNPLFGIGPGTFQETYLSYAEKFDEPYLEWAVPQPHNVFLAFYLQTGLIGFVGFVLILIWFFNRRNRAMPCFYNIINALMIYILIHGLVDTTYWKNDLALMFWLIIGMMFVKNLAIDPVRNFTKKYTENKLS